MSAPNPSLAGKCMALVYRRFRITGKENGGAEEDRTPALRVANATLFQLSYRAHAYSGGKSRSPVNRFQALPGCVPGVTSNCLTGHWRAVN